MQAIAAAVVALLAAGCAASHPDRAYFASLSDPTAVRLSHTLYRAARAAGDDPARYSFAMLRSRHVGAYHTDEAIFYFSDGLAQQPAAHVDALVAHEVAHEILGHAGRRAALALGTTAGLTVMGVIVPGLSLADLVINPLIVRAFSRDQEIAADVRAVGVIRAMGYESPRRTLADALRAAAAINGEPPGGFFATEPTLEERLAALEPLELERTPQTRATQRARPAPGSP